MPELTTDDKEIVKRILAMLPLGLSEDECWIWPGYKTEKGYGIIMYSYTSIRVHRKILENKLNRKLVGEECALHSCDRRSCINPKHLFMGTQLENVEDMKLKKRAAPKHGAHNGMTILNEILVKEIRQSTESNKAIGKRLSVSPQVINHVRKRNTWRHVD